MEDPIFITVAIGSLLFLVVESWQVSAPVKKALTVLVSCVLVALAFCLGRLRAAQIA